MHESTRRRTCRLLFFVICLVPTLGTTTWAIVRGSSFAGRQRCEHWKQQTSAALHLAPGTAKIAQVDNPSPRRFLLHDVQLRDAREASRMGRVQTHSSNLPIEAPRGTANRALAPGPFLFASATTRHISTCAKRWGLSSPSGCWLMDVRGRMPRPVPIPATYCCGGRRRKSSSSNGARRCSASTVG